MSRTRRLIDLATHLGPRWMAFRASYAVRVRSGMVRAAMPTCRWDDIATDRLLRDAKWANRERFYEHWQANAAPGIGEPENLAPSAALFDEWDGQAQSPLDEARAIRDGMQPYFGRGAVQAGFPPDWHRDPQSGEQFPADRHWSLIGDFARGDIKTVWEINRFGSAYSLVRSYWRTGDEQYAEWFWQLVDDWRERNPPQFGVNWKCGQEISLRLMAWCFGLWTLRRSQATTPERVHRLVQTIAVSARRIERNIGYALSQKNNHGVSEAVGLWTVGTLFPELREADRWRTAGQELLESLVRELVYEDGAFSQQSFNYQRVMLDGYLWCLAWAKLRGIAFSREVIGRIKRSAEFLYDLQDLQTGGVPNYGANDGAHALPLTNCGYADFRPEIQAVEFLTTGHRVYASGPWDELLFWLCGSKACSAPIEIRPQQDLNAVASGYYSLRSPAGFAFVRSPHFQHRPSHADLMHVDLWWRGQNIACDAGTYSYNHDAAWDSSFASTTLHNTVTIGGLDQMERVGRFLWLPWASSTTRCRATSRNGVLAYWEGEHDGYSRRLGRETQHIRGLLRIGAEDWVVVDWVKSSSDLPLRLHWLLGDFPCQHHDQGYEFKLSTTNGDYWLQLATTLASPSCSLVRGDEHSARGWKSATYGSRQPTWSVAFEGTAREAWFLSKFGPAPAMLSCAPEALRISGHRWCASLHTGSMPGSAAPLFTQIAVEGELQDELRCDTASLR